MSDDASDNAVAAIVTETPIAENIAARILSEIRAAGYIVASRERVEEAIVDAIVGHTARTTQEYAEVMASFALSNLNASE